MRVNRKELKQQARRSLKQHYWIFVVLCLAAGYIGAESFGGLELITMASEGELTAEVSTGMVPETPDMSTAIAEAIMGEDEKSRETSRALVQEAKDDQGSNAVLGRTRGVFAEAVNRIESGAMIATVIMAVRSVVDSTEAMLILFIVVSLVLAFLVWFFFINMFTVIMRRFFLEGRTYEKVSPQRLLFLLRVKRWVRVSCTMFAASFFQFLWSLTLIGGVIKRYSYFLVPYIAAENPNPYRMAAYAEYYVRVRETYKKEEGEKAELLNDPYLFEKPDLGTVVETYSDLIYLLDEEQVQKKKSGSLTEALADFFGVTLFYSANEREYEERVKHRIRLASLQDVISGKAYPIRMSAIPEHEKRSRIEMINYFRRYSVWSLILMFFAFSFIGWLWEVSLHLISDGEFVNRGVLHGPWLPIYGCGGVLILVVLNRLRARPLLEFGATVVLCGCVEYFSSLYLEMAHNGQRWWDYSGYFLNLNGRICAEGLLVFGLGGLAIVYVLAPILDNQVRRIPGKALVPVSLALAAVFVGDLAYSSVIRGGSCLLQRTPE